MKYNIKQYFTPFSEVTIKSRFLINLIWSVLLLLTWTLMTRGDKKLFPMPEQVLDGLVALWQEGLVVHVFSSLLLFTQAVLIAMIVSLIIVYTSPIPFLSSIASFVSKIRYLPLVGLTYYLTILTKDARSMQIWVLVIFMSTYFITSLLAMIRDIPTYEFDHARTLGCNKWEILWEVVIKGRFDIVIDTLRQNLSIIWMMLVTVESILVASGGIGVLIKNSDKFFAHGRIVALQIIILLVGLSLDWLLDTARKSIWRYASK